MVVAGRNEALGDVGIVGVEFAGSEKNKANWVRWAGNAAKNEINNDKAVESMALFVRGC